MATSCQVALGFRNLKHFELHEENANQYFDSNALWFFRFCGHACFSRPCLKRMCVVAFRGGSFTRWGRTPSHMSAESVFVTEFSWTRNILWIAEFSRISVINFFLACRSVPSWNEIAHKLVLTRCSTFFLHTLWSWPCIMTFEYSHKWLFICVKDNPVAE
jgi:hypothetical protein